MFHQWTLSLFRPWEVRNNLPVYFIILYRIVSYCIFCLTFLHKHLKNIQREDLFKEFHHGDGQQLWWPPKILMNKFKMTLEFPEMWMTQRASVVLVLKIATKGKTFCCVPSSTFPAIYYVSLTIPAFPFLPAATMTSGMKRIVLEFSSITVTYYLLENEFFPKMVFLSHDHHPNLFSLDDTGFLLMKVTTLDSKEGKRSSPPPPHQCVPSLHNWLRALNSFTFLLFPHPVSTTDFQSDFHLLRRLFVDTLVWNVIIHTHDTFNNLALKPATFNDMKSHLDPPCWNFTAAIPVNADILSDGYFLFTKLSFILSLLASGLSFILSLFFHWPHSVLMGRHFRDACISPRYCLPSCTSL